MISLWTRWLGRRRRAIGPAPFIIKAAVRTDAGCVREINEDHASHYCPGSEGERDEKGLLTVVADGMGGHAAGEVASQLAVEVVGREYYRGPKNIVKALERAFDHANRAILGIAQGNAEWAGMGATCTALAIHGSAAYACHVGDSRLYLVREGAIYRLTEDDSMVMQMAREGLITRQAAEKHQDKNVLLKAMGTQEEIGVCAWREPLSVKRGDRFLLCTDGLTDLVEDHEIKEIMTTIDAERASEMLIWLAKNRGGHDNITVAIVSLLAPFESDRQIRETREIKLPCP